jgi:3-hydroxyisobutyrate dehydrogenase-like beta-hydroxyacid dehydrogenase
MATAFGGARSASLTTPSAGAFQQLFQTMAARGVGALSSSTIQVEGSLL